jgi:predicted nucleotidyltransferase component of viral defense system
MLFYQTVSEELLSLLKSVQRKKEFSKWRLVGGTALALQYGHRISVDLDFYGNLQGMDVYPLLKEFGQVQRMNSGAFMQMFNVNGIKVDFLQQNYPWIDEALIEDELILASEKDIAALKIAAIINRGSRKDFVDLSFVLKRFSLEEVLDFYSAKYGDANVFLALKSLTYFEDAEQEPMPTMLTSLAWDDVKTNIRSEVRKFI